MTKNEEQSILKHLETFCAENQGSKLSSATIEGFLNQTFRFLETLVPKEEKSEEKKN